jgi:hypothetical protein
MRHALLVPAVFTFLLSGAVMAQTWSEYENRQEGWLMNFPAEPRTESRPYTTAFGATVPSKVYSAELPSGSYSFTFVELAGHSQDEAQAIAHAVNALRQKGRATYDDAHNLDGVPGHQISVVQPNGRLTLGSVYFYNQRLYITEASVPPGAAPPQQFQQSITMLHPDGRRVNVRREAEERAKQQGGGEYK